MFRPSLLPTLCFLPSAISLRLLPSALLRPITTQAFLLQHPPIRPRPRFHSTTTMATREEKDSMGFISVQADRYWGAQTQRFVTESSIHTHPPPRT